MIHSKYDYFLFINSKLCVLLRVLPYKMFIPSPGRNLTEVKNFYKEALFSSQWPKHSAVGPGAVDGVWLPSPI